MLKPNIKNLLFYIFFKYLIFYIFMMFRNNNFALIEIFDLKTLEDLFYYLWTFLFLPVLISIILLVPLNYTFKIKNGLYFLLVINLVLVTEYFIYTFLASQLNLWNGIYNAIIGLLLLGLFFYKEILFILKNN